MPRQGADILTLGACRDGDFVTHGARSAEGSYTDGVGRVGCEMK